MNERNALAPAYAKCRALSSVLQRVGRKSVGHALNLVLPPRCLSCSEPLERHGTLCASCWPQLRWIRAPYCGCCGRPFLHAMGADALCGACLTTAPKAARMRSALAYDAGSRRMVSRFKYYDGTLLAPVLAEWMLQAGKDTLEGAALIVPVPLHWRRLIWRRFNQAALLSAELSKRTALPHLPRLLYRTRHTTPQAALSRAKRLTNVKGLFRVRPEHAAALVGKIVLLVDDVYTTGATLEACSKALLAAGAKEVRCLTLARTLDDVAVMDGAKPKEKMQ